MGLVFSAAWLAAGAGDKPRQPLGLPSVEWPKNNPYSAVTDGAEVSTGIREQKGGRSAPTIINRAFSLAQFWDGRAATLEEQA